MEIPTGESRQALASREEETATRDVTGKILIILSIIERLSSFRGKYILPRLVPWKVSFIQRCHLFRVSFIRGSTVIYVPGDSKIKLSTPFFPS